MTISEEADNGQTIDERSMNIDPDNVSSLTPLVERNQLRMLEAIMFAAEEPLDVEAIAALLPLDVDLQQLLEELKAAYSNRGVNLVCLDDKWSFRTAEDLAYLMQQQSLEERRLSRAALETLAIIAYHQPVTRAEIEDIRGVMISRGTLDVLLETGWIKMRGRRKTPGRPVTYGTTEDFLQHFGLDSLIDLPGVDDLKAAGLLSTNLPPDLIVPMPMGLDELTEDEDPLDDEIDEEEGLT